MESLNRPMEIMGGHHREPTSDTAIALYLPEYLFVNLQILGSFRRQCAQFL
jgi:hypothetical protein